MVSTCRIPKLLEIGKCLTFRTETCQFGNSKHIWNGYKNLSSLEEIRNNCRLSVFRCFHTSREPRCASAKLTPQEVDRALCANEFTHEFKGGYAVKAYDVNQLSSNNPIEDTRAEATCLLTQGSFFGIFDGHGGSSCAQVIAKRLFNYLAASLLSGEQLKEYIESLRSVKPLKLLEHYNDNVQFVEDLRQLYANNFTDFVRELAEENSKVCVESAFKRAYFRLDEDLSREALPDGNGIINRKTLSVAMSGAVSCVAHVNGPHLYIGHVGDCNAVLGCLNDSNMWIPKKLTAEHNTFNQGEVERILKEHPKSESNTVIRMERLLGQLAPLRAFGDFRYKWSKELMNEVVVKNFGEKSVPPNYHTPPYLTVQPDVIHHRLTPQDKFLVIASDGLWDFVSSLEVVRLIGEHMRGKVTLTPLKLPRKTMKVTDINDMLLQRKDGLDSKPKDRNAATHLIRNALGGSELGVLHSKLSEMLSLPQNVSRLFRDDITITVIYFDSEYLRHCPS